MADRSQFSRLSRVIQAMCGPDRTVTEGMPQPPCSSLYLGFRRGIAKRAAFNVRRASKRGTKCDVVNSALCSVLDRGDNVYAWDF